MVQTIPFQKRIFEDMDCMTTIRTRCPTVASLLLLNFEWFYSENSFFSVRCIIPLFHPPIGVYTRYFLTLGATMDFFSSGA